MPEKRIFLFGFWGLEVMYYHMINIAREKGFDVEWRIVTTTDHHQKLLSDLMGQDKVLVLDPVLVGVDVLKDLDGVFRNG